MLLFNTVPAIFATVTVATSVHPAASVIVTVYIPDTSPEMTDVTAAFDHR